MATRSESRLQEDLASLYLRLNGFFVTPLVVHSPIHGRNHTEVDALALRLRYNEEPERQIGPDPLLDLSTKYTDLALCEVKSKGQALRFNDALSHSQSAIESVLRWSGLFKGTEIDCLSTQLIAAFSHKLQTFDRPITIQGPRKTRIRALLFSPERPERRNNQPWFISGTDVMQYIWQCLCPSAPRASCATTYDFQAWGRHEPIVRYFKSVGTRGPGTISDLYAFANAGARYGSASNPFSVRTQPA